MAQATFQFPRGFMWGTATASHQVEGQNQNNNWSAWEQQPGHIVDGQTAGLACDWWGGRWREDFDRAAESGQNAHRLSIEWSRVQPASDRWDESALEHYRQMVRGLNERNITPVVTLHHFTDPLWLSEQGGWENLQTVALFNTYVERVVGALKEYVPLWCTINEPNVVAYMGYLAGLFPPGKHDLKATLNVMKHFALAHSTAYHTIHRIQPQARVGIVINYRPILPKRAWFPLDGLVAKVQSDLFNRFYPEALQSGVMRFPGFRQRASELKNTQDFLGINYYTQEQAAFSPLAVGELFGKRSFPEDALLSEHGSIAHQPQGLLDGLKWARQFGVPLLVTENGVEDRPDQLRPRYLAEHVHKVWRAVNFNWPVKGYFHWTLVDNFEWHEGWNYRFGLWELDTKTQARHKRPSADLYAAICHANGLSSEMVSTYCPHALPALFPD